MTGRIFWKKTILALLIAVLLSLPLGWIVAMLLTPVLWRLEPVLHLGTRRTLRTLGLGVSADLGHRGDSAIPGAAVGVLKSQVQGVARGRLTKNDHRPLNPLTNPAPKCTIFVAI